MIEFVVFVFRKWHPVAALVLAFSVGSIMNGYGLVNVSISIQDRLGFLAYVGLIIMAGGGLDKIAEKLQ